MDSKTLARANELNTIIGRFDSFKESISKNLDFNPKNLTQNTAGTVLNTTHSVFGLDYVKTPEFQDLHESYLKDLALVKERLFVKIEEMRSSAEKEYLDL